MSTISLSQLNFISLHVSDLEGACAWYARHLGFTVAGSFRQGRLLEAPGLALYVAEGRRSRDGEEEPLPAEFAPCLGVESVKAAWEACQAAGLFVLSPYEEFAPGFAGFAFADPDGNRLEIAGRP